MTTISDVLANDDPTSFAIALSDLVFQRYDRDGFEALSAVWRGRLRCACPNCRSL